MISTPLKTSDISIIIPTLNEEDNIELLAGHLAEGDHEVFIVDGGSKDATLQLAEKYGFKTVAVPPGRSQQLNCGAQAANGKVLLFLHADTRLPASFPEDILRILRIKSNIAGAFRLSIDKPTPAMRFICACANIRSKLFQLPYGDQAIFILKSNFMKLGMFPDLPIMEDYVFMKNARKKGEIALLDEFVVTSNRRWKKLGIIRTTLINQLVILGYYCKVSPEKLALLYRR